MLVSLSSFLELLCIFGPWVWMGYLVGSLSLRAIILAVANIFHFTKRTSSVFVFISELIKNYVLTIFVMGYAENHMQCISCTHARYAFILGLFIGYCWSSGLKFKGGKVVFTTVTAVLFSVRFLSFVPEACLGYVIGSIPFGVLIPRIFGKPDPRTVASKNPGTTNVYRTAGLVCAVCVAIADILKGALPVWFMLSHFGHKHGAIMAISCVIGSVWSCFLKGKGGKGVATASGTLFPFMPLWMIGAILVWIMIAKCTKYAILASCAAILAVMLGGWMTGPTDIHVPLILVLSAIIMFKHKQNFVRLFQGKENKVEKKY